MGRPRSFDTDAVLDAAVSHFWVHGYASTSIRDIAQGTGLNAPSIYNAFGNKRALFAAALERYMNQYVRSRIALHDARPCPVQAISGFFEAVIQRAVHDESRRGCFLINSALDIAPHDREAGVQVAAGLEEIRRFFARRLQDAKARGTMNTERDCDKAANLLLSALLGLRVLARANPNEEMLRDIASQALTGAGLRDDHPPSSTH